MKTFAKKDEKVYVRFALGFLCMFLCVLLIGADTALACTTIIVGKKASADGSIFSDARQIPTGSALSVSSIGKHGKTAVSSQTLPTGFHVLCRGKPAAI